MDRFKNILFTAILVLSFAVTGSADTLNFSDLKPELIVFQADTTDSTSADSLEEDKNKDLPLKPERKISFSTEEGTWMSVDVSPDGSTIAFDLFGDIYTMSIEGGQAELLLGGMAFETHPRYSPDGRYLLFTSDRDGADNIWYMDLEAEHEDDKLSQVTDGNNKIPSAEWSPGGDYIVAAKGGRINKLWMYHREGGSGQVLNEGSSQIKTIDPAFGHKGRFIYYSQRRGPWNYNAQFPQYQIGVYDRENGDQSIITSRYGSAFTPTLSSDGKYMVYGTRFETKTGLVIRNLSDGTERWLAYPVQRDDQESIATQGVYPGMSFTPDNKSLIAFYGGKIWRIPVDGGDSKEIPFSVDVEQDLGPQLEFKYPIEDDKEVLATQIRDAVPSPNGNQLAFTVLNRLYVMDYPEGTPRRLTDNNMTEANPAWSPDGNWIVYASWDGDEGHLYKIEPNKRRPNPVKLTNDPAIYGSPVWSYNNRIVFLKGSAYGYQTSSSSYAFYGSLDDIMWISPDGGEQNFIAKSNGRSNPHFVKNNDRIYMNRGNDLISLRWDGTDEQKHVEVTGIRTYGSGNHEGEVTTEHLDPAILHDDGNPEEPTPPSSASVITMAPEGDQALAQINNEIYTLTIPKLGEAPSISVARPGSAKFPAKKLTTIGGQFPAWSSDGRSVHWSIGNAHLVYNLDEAEAFADSVKAAKRAQKEEQDKVENEDKEEKVNGDKENDKEDKKPDTYKPDEQSIEVNYQKDIPEGMALLRGARIITMDGDRVIENGDILIGNNRIKAVGESGSLDVPSNAEVIDVSGKTIVPGFVDTHAHLRPSFGVHKTESWAYTANLAYGVTTTRDPQTGTTDVLTYGDMVEAGDMLGPRIYSTGPGVGFWAYNIRDLDHAKDVLKQYSKYYHTKYIKMYIAGNRKQRQWIIMAAKEQQLMPTTEGALDWKLNMTQLVDGYPGHEHSYPVHPIYNDVIKMTAESKMAYTPTLLVSYGGPWAENYYYATEEVYNDPKLSHFTPYSDLAPKSRRRGFWAMEEEHVFQKHAEFTNDLVVAGGLAGVGSHGQLQGLGFHWELWSMQAGGMSELNALRTATILGAQSLGLDGDLGSIEEGKLADLVILDRNPLNNIRNTNTVFQIMKNGRLYKGNSLDEVYPRQRNAAPFWWRQEKPGTNLPGMKK